MIGNEIVYQIFVRNYSQEGSFESVRKDLKRIKDLGVDIIYLTPIHPISELNRKGTYGSPYAIKDYFEIEPSYGKKEDFVNLINEIHKSGMKIIIDMVFNHTGRDNVLLTAHPEYYYYKDGKLGNRVGDWSDVYDLDTSRNDTQEYLLNVLQYWKSLGVDGYRFDVASMIPLEFFKKARKALGKDIIFVGESIDYDFAKYLRSINDTATRDEDMFPTFDALYNYSWFRDFERYINYVSPIDDLIKALNDDSNLLKEQGLRLNCLENHDVDRIANRLSKDNLLDAVDFIFNLKGLTFIYMGQEYGVTHKPDLFEKDPVIWKKDEEVYNHYLKAIKNKKAQPVDVYQTFTKVNENTIKVATYFENKLIRENSYKF